MALSPTCFLILSVLVITLHGGPLHPHRNDIKSEKYVVTAAIFSGNPDPKWTITQDDMNNNKNVTTIAKAIDWYLHKTMGHGGKGKAPQLASRGVYKGFTINHFVNGKSLHETILPACAIPKLEEALVVYTAGASLDKKLKELIVNATKVC